MCVQPHEDRWLSYPMVRSVLRSEGQPALTSVKYCTACRQSSSQKLAPVMYVRAASRRPMAELSNGPKRSEIGGPAGAYFGEILHSLPPVQFPKTCAGDVCACSLTKTDG